MLNTKVGTITPVHGIVLRMYKHTNYYSVVAVSGPSIDRDPAVGKIKREFR